jgi:glycosyltransferase involved in cell wall biosynthesis
MKQKLLFVYSEMMTGGSTTSLLNLLNTIDYSKYEVDLQLFRNRGPFLKDIPEKVNLLPEAAKYGYSVKDKIMKFLVLLFSGTIFKAKYYKFKYKNKAQLQIYGYGQVLYSRKNNKKYDAAIGFLELWSDYYVIRKTNPAKKIIWIHTDYKAAGFSIKIDKKIFEKADNIVLVSEECLNHFNDNTFLYKNKSLFIENIFSKKILIEKSMKGQIALEGNSPKFLTVCRLSVYTKGLDRMLEVCKRLKSEGLKFTWFVLGGDNTTEFLDLYETYDLKDCVILLGQQENPYPYYIKADVYIQPSRYEGKPMTVTEAQILGLPVIATDYASAKEQVKDGIDGLVVENNEDAIYNAMKKVIENPGLLKVFSENVRKRDFCNLGEINKLYNLLKR